MASTKQLKNGESVCLKAFEVLTIPDISIINSDKDQEQIVKEHIKLFDGLLSDVHQIFKNTKNDIALEILWVNEQVKNQAYKANIKIILILRTIGDSEITATSRIEEISELVVAVLQTGKYDYKEIDYSDLENRIHNLNEKHVKALIKEENIIDLQNTIMQRSLSFDVIHQNVNNFEKIINVFIHNPGVSVSFQLIPTIYEPYETYAVEKTMQTLDTLNKGIMAQGMGNVSFSLAQKEVGTYRYYSENKNSPSYLFNILVFAEENLINILSAQLSSMIASSNEKRANLIIRDVPNNVVDVKNNLYPLPWAINSFIINNFINNSVFDSNVIDSGLKRVPFIITGEEASSFFSLPIGTKTVSAGFKVNYSGKNSKTYTDNIINSGDIVVGKLKSTSDNSEIGLSLKDLTKHMLVVGTPGSGKTTFSIGLLDRLWKEYKIPFLVIEPAKNEYRALIKSIPDLQVFTPGKNHISPLVLNPFVPPKNVKLGTYKSTLKTAFMAAVSMTSPLDKIFEETINNCYSDFKWLDFYTASDKGKVFNISDFIKCFQNTFENIGYTGDAKNIGRAGTVRLKGIANLFDNYDTIPIEDLLKKPTVIELAAIENVDEKALIISILLLSILSYVNANYIGVGDLKNIILLEEAHVLLDSNSHNGEGEADPSGIAQGLLKRMLAEMRSYGVGVVIADQSPRKVSTDIVALTDIKVIFRLVEGSDKQIIRDSANMSDVQYQQMGRLKPGEAFLFFNKLDEPEEVITPEYRLNNKIEITLSDDNIAKLSKYWDGKSFKPYPECAYCVNCSENCDINCRLLAKEIARRIFVKFFNSESKDFAIVQKVFSQISYLIKQELNGETLNDKVFRCIKLHLFRKIRYETKIKINDEIVKNSLTRK